MTARARSLLTVSLFASLLFAPYLEGSSWIRRIDSPQPVIGVGVAPMGTAFVVGWNSYEDSLALFDADGSTRASVRLDGFSLFRSMNTTPDGSVLVAGGSPTGVTVNGQHVDTVQGVVYAVAPNGRVSHKTIIGVINSSGSGKSLIRAANGACQSGNFTYVVGTHGPEAAYIGRMKPDGYLDWVRVYDWPGLDELITVTCIDDGGAIAAGMIGGPVPVIQRVDSEGRLVWRTIFGSLKGRFLSVRPDGNGSLVAVGVIQSAGLDIVVARVGLDGKPEWVKQVTSPRDEVAVSAHVTSRSTIAIGGFVYGESTVSPVAIELRPDGSLIRSEEISSARIPTSNAVAAGPDASGELGFAVASGKSIFVARWDGTMEWSCGSDAGMTVSDLATTLTTMAPALPDHNTNNFPWMESSPSDVEVAVAKLDCAGSMPIQQPVAPADELKLHKMAEQELEKSRFKNEVRDLFTAQRWDELEAMAVALRQRNETWPNGDWKLYEFYHLLGQSRDGSPAFALRKAWLEARPEHTAARIATAYAHIYRYWGEREEEDLRITQQQFAALPGGLKDPELATIRMLAARLAGDEWWDEFEEGVRDFPGYYMLYSQASLGSLRDLDRLARVIEFARSTGQAMGWGDSLVARVMNNASLYVDARVWPISWKEVQKAYLDLFKVYPESYKNMFRYGMVACDVRDKVVAASIFSNPEIDGPHDVLEWSSPEGLERVSSCRSWAIGQPAGVWAKTPPPREDGLSGAEFVRTLKPPADPELAKYAGRMLDLVSVNLSAWPKLIVDSSDDAYQGVEVGFFARASNSLMCFVTASATGHAPVLRVRQKDGNIAPQSALPTEDRGEWKSALYRVDQAPLIDLKLSGVRPKALMYVLTVSPGENGQAVSRGLIYRAEGATPQKAAPTFGVVMQPGSPLPPPGSPVLYDSGYLAGVVVSSSIVDGWVLAECESAERILQNVPNKWKLDRK